MIITQETLTSDANLQVTRFNLSLSQENLLTKTITIRSVSEIVFASIISSNILINEEPSSVIDIVSLY